MFQLARASKCLFLISFAFCTPSAIAGQSVGTPTPIAGCTPAKASPAALQYFLDRLPASNPNTGYYSNYQLLPIFPWSLPLYTRNDSNGYVDDASAACNLSRLALRGVVPLMSLGTSLDVYEKNMMARAHLMVGIPYTFFKRDGFPYGDSYVRATDANGIIHYDLLDAAPAASWTQNEINGYLKNSYGQDIMSQPRIFAFLGDLEDAGPTVWASQFPQDNGAPFDFFSYVRGKLWNQGFTSVVRSFDPAAWSGNWYEFDNEGAVTGRDTIMPWLYAEDAFLKYRNSPITYHFVTWWGMNQNNTFWLYDTRTPVLATGDRVKFFADTGTVPNGIQEGAIYKVRAEHYTCGYAEMQGRMGPHCVHYYVCNEYDNPDNCSIPFNGNTGGGVTRVEIQDRDPNRYLSQAEADREYFIALINKFNLESGPTIRGEAEGRHIIPWVAPDENVADPIWQGNTLVAFQLRLSPDEIARYPRMSKAAYQDMLIHLYLRGADSFAVWNDEFYRDLRGLGDRVQQQAQTLGEVAEVANFLGPYAQYIRSGRVVNTQDIAPFGAAAISARELVDSAGTRRKLMHVSSTNTGSYTVWMNPFPDRLQWPIALWAPSAANTLFITTLYSNGYLEVRCPTAANPAGTVIYPNSNSLYVCNQ